MRDRVFGSIALLALVTAACSTTTTTGPGGIEVTTVQIAACTNVQGDQPPADPLGVDFSEQLKEPGVLNVGSDNDFPPFESIPPGADVPEGFDVDLYTEVASRLGIEAKSTTTDFSTLATQSVPDGTFDVGISAMTITEERKQSVDFTIPYFAANLSLAVNAEETPEILTIDDLADATVGVQEGTTGQDCANSLAADGKIGEVKSFGDPSPMFQDLAAGRIQAVINDQPASEGFIEREESIAVVQVIETQEQYGFAISKDKPDLRVAINEALTEIMNDGTYARIYEEWFGTPPPYEVPLS